MAQVEVKVKLDLPPGVELLGYERSGDGHGFEVKFPLPHSCRCEKCGHDTAAPLECLGKLTPQQRAAVKTHRVDMGNVYGAVCSEELPNRRLVVDRFHVAKQFNAVVDELREKTTRKYKAPLSKAEQKRFRWLMWEFRRDPQDLKAEEREALDRLFVELPVLKDVYELRLRFKEIFDTAPDAAAAEQQLAELRARIESLGLDFSKFWRTYDNWKTGILNYFDGHYTSAAVEGINNTARVITKRCYGVKSSETLWNRPILDLDRASEAIGRSIADLREMVSRLKAVFLAFCT